MQQSGRGREMTLSACSEPRRVIGTGVRVVTPIHCRCRGVMDDCVYMPPTVNHMSHMLLPNHYASSYTKRTSGPGPHHYESVLLHHSVFEFLTIVLEKFLILLTTYTSKETRCIDIVITKTILY
jgi:hypothetical protein